MQTRDLGAGRHLLVLDRGEELISTITDFLGERGIVGGSVTGIGAIRDHTLAYFDRDKKEYLKRTFEEVMELGSLIGTIGTLDGEPFLHVHATACGPELIAFTGHLMKAEVAVTVELLLTDFGVELPRALDEGSGLNLFSLAPPTEEAGEAQDEAGVK